MIIWPLSKGMRTDPKWVSDKRVRSLFQLCHQGLSAPLRKRELSSKNNFSMRYLRHMEKYKSKETEHSQTQHLKH